MFCKPVLLLALFFVVSSASDMSIITYDDTHGLNSSPSLQTHDHLNSLYNSWLVKHRKNYNALGEKEFRFEIFKENARFIHQHNSMHNHTYKLGFNKFADLTNDEYRSMYLGGKMLQRVNKFTSDRFMFKDADRLPDSIDWRDKGAVAPVKDQGQCGEFYLLFFLYAATAIYHHLYFHTSKHFNFKS